MAKMVYRESEDKLSREAWEFDVRGDILLLRSYRIERRAVPKGRFRVADTRERWVAMDERRYYSGLERPLDIPHDVLREAVERSVAIHLGWTNAESVIGHINVVAA